MQDLKIAYVQSDLFWENPAANRKHFESILNGLKTQPDLIVLPETFTTGFPVDPNHFSETSSGETIDWMKAQAKKTSSGYNRKYLAKARRFLPKHPNLDAA